MTCPLSPRDAQVKGKTNQREAHCSRPESCAPEMPPSLLPWPLLSSSSQLLLASAVWS